MSTRSRMIAVSDPQTGSRLNVYTQMPGMD